LSTCHDEQIAGVADVAGSEDKLTNLKLFYEFLLQESRTLLFIKRDQNPVLLADFLEQHGIVRRAAKEFSMPFVANSCSIKLFD
jgi:hypothetical protein